MNITLIGMPGSGKSYIGEKLACDLGFELIELDTLMENEYRSPLQEILDAIGEQRFLDEQEQGAISYTKNRDNLVISPGGSIIYSDVAMQHLKDISKVIYLEAGLETIESRIKNVPRGIIGLDKKSLSQIYQERTKLYEEWADCVIKADLESQIIVKNIKEVARQP